MSLSVRRAWIEISIQIFEKGQARSLSVRRAWIEIPITLDSGALPGVALRKESVDRNAGKAPYMENAVVALRKESVDRNVLLYIL